MENEKHIFIYKRWLKCSFMAQKTIKQNIETNWKH